MIPMKLTKEKQSGTAKSCGHNAAAGVVAREAKSGALLRSDHKGARVCVDVHDVC